MREFLYALVDVIFPAMRARKVAESKDRHPAGKKAVEVCGVGGCVMPKGHAGAGWIGSE
jgi:hypothetical protein